MNVVLVCGGTAGHITPALAIADLLKKEYPSANISFIGTRDGMENRLVPSAGYPIYPIHMYGLSRSLSPKNVAAVFLLMKACVRAKERLKAASPDLVIATGGYITFPVARAAKKLHIPVILHESNAVPGLAVRMSERYADRVLLNMEAAKKNLRFPERAVCVGMPVREIFSLSREEARKKLGLTVADRFLLSFGGSLGAAPINEAMLAFYKKYARTYPSLYALHGTGREHYKEFMDTMKEARLPERIRAVPYVEDMGTVMAAADLVIARAGAATLSEIAKTHVPSILIPSPYVTGDHQRKNANVYKERGAAAKIEERELSADLLNTRISTLLFNGTERKSMQKELKKMYIPDTNDRILSEIRAILQR